MSSTPYPTMVQLIQDGDPVNAATTNTPITQLADRTQSNKEKIDNGLFGSAIVAYDVPVESATAVGMAVYIDTDMAYKRALAAIGVDDGTTFTLAKTSFAVGVVYYKHSATLADVVLQGVCTIHQDSINAVKIGTLVSGDQIYVSSDALKPGYITCVRPQLGIPVGTIVGPDVNGYYKIIVNPGPRDTLEGHIHYRVSLKMVSAATADDEGWLAVAGNFAGLNVPAAAAYGYNIPQDAVLSVAWPPMPLFSCYMERNGTGLRLWGDSGEQTVIVNSDGIWWMSDCAGQQPFGQSAIDPGVGCVSYPDRVDLWFSKLTAKTSENVVTSLTPADSTIVIRGPGNVAATAGDLTIRANLPLSLAANEAGYLAVKNVDGMTLKRGPVTEGIVSTSPSITLTGSTTVSNSGTTYQAGLIQLDYTPPLANLEGGLDILVFDNAEIATVNDVPHNVFRAGRDGSIRGRLRVGTVGLQGAYNLTFTITFYAYIDGQFPSIAMTTRKISPSAQACTNVALPAADSALETLTFADCVGATGKYFEKKTTQNLSVNAGDLVYVTISRAGSSDGYAGDIGILDISWKLDAAPN